MWDQLTYFKQYIATIKQHFGEEKAQNILDHSFFLVVSSSNDLAHTFLAQSYKYDRTSYANFLADSAAKFVRVSILTNLYKATDYRVIFKTN